jgi:hypothetical protein
VLAGDPSSFRSLTTLRRFLARKEEILVAKRKPDRPAAEARTSDELATEARERDEILTEQRYEQLRLARTQRERFSRAHQELLELQATLPYGDPSDESWAAEFVAYVERMKVLEADVNDERFKPFTQSQRIASDWRKSTGQGRRAGEVLIAAIEQGHDAVAGYLALMMERDEWSNIDFTKAMAQLLAAGTQLGVQASAEATQLERSADHSQQHFSDNGTPSQEPPIASAELLARAVDPNIQLTVPERDQVFAHWRMNGMTIADIRDKWNAANPQEHVGTGVPGYECVKTATRRMLERLGLRRFVPGDNE